VRFRRELEHLAALVGDEDVPARSTATPFAPVNPVNGSRRCRQAGRLSAFPDGLGEGAGSGNRGIGGAVGNGVGAPGHTGSPGLVIITPVSWS
jgi:hypothetical protein